MERIITDHGNGLITSTARDYLNDAGLDRLLADIANVEPVSDLRADRAIRIFGSLDAVDRMVLGIVESGAVLPLDLDESMHLGDVGGDAGFTEEEWRELNETDR